MQPVRSEIADLTIAGWKALVLLSFGHNNLLLDKWREECYTLIVVVEHNNPLTKPVSCSQREIGFLYRLIMIIMV